MDIRREVPLAGFNTLALPGRAEYFCEVGREEHLREALSFARGGNLPVTVLGGGSNVVLAGDIPGLVVRMGLAGIELLADDGDQVQVRIAAGENWPDLVQTTLDRGWYGLENLSLIPGCAGAAPIQNIGAYGVELSDHFVSLQAVAVDSGETVRMSASDCRFGYRDSVFKGELAGRLVITAITLSLSRIPRLRLDYPELNRALADCANPSPVALSEAVCRLRRAKLPDPARLANAGSFFKNPVVDSESLQRLRDKYPDMPWYPLAEGGKIPAAWLIEKAGWKGRRQGSVGVHDRQALVLINYGGASGEELLGLAREIAGDVRRRFGIALEIEPRILGAAEPG
jgi:UDP-N-acetylmuramate dehydrogenase